MEQEERPDGPGAIMILIVLTGLGLFIWHVTIHPDPQLNDPGPLPPVRVEGIPPFVAVASQHDDRAAVGFTASVHQRDRHNFVSHLHHIAVQRYGLRRRFPPFQVRERPRAGHTPSQDVFWDGQI